MHSLPLNKTKLNELIKQCKHLNIFPIYLPTHLRPSKHDPISHLLVDLVKEGVEYLSTMTNDEIESLISAFPPGIKMFIEQGPSIPHNDEQFSERIALYYITAEVQQKYLSFKSIVRNDLYNSEVLKVYPELRKKLDMDGLLHLDDEFLLLDGGIEYKDHVIHYHQFLRRGYRANPNFDFLSIFIRYYLDTKSTNTFRIAVDHQRIMPKEYYQKIFELDRWYGPLFDPKKLDDPRAVGLTIVKRNRDSLFELANSLDRTEFFWIFYNGIKTIQIEEISDVGYQFDYYYLNRYVHSERDIQNQVLKHFDGAIKVYLQDTYKDRLKVYMPTQGKCHSKIKLFRIDGNIEIDKWIELISFFYKSNEMIIEYFNPEQFEQIFESRVRDFKTWKRKQQKK